jgi:protein TonB
MGADRLPSLEDRNRARERLHEAMAHRGDRRLFGVALGLALLLHGLAALIHFPEWRGPLIPDRPHAVIVVRRYVPPPPKVEKRQVTVQKKLTRRVPVPDPTPEQPEPIREPEPEPEPEVYPADVEILIGVPTPPAPSEAPGPLLAGTGGVTNPVLIPESKIKPEYPELARLARLEANVILQAVIGCDGTVHDARVLRCTQASLGFEESAIAAVRQWRYEPATQDGRPVEVYFTVFVEFSLL